MNDTSTAIAPTSFPLSEWIHQIVPEVFQTMVSLEVTTATEKEMPSDVERIVGAIGLGGESVGGAIYLQLTAPLADEITSLLLGLGKDETPTAADVNDAIGELCNMISGGLKSNLANHGFPCAISPPRDRPRHLLFGGGPARRCPGNIFLRLPATPPGGGSSPSSSN